MQLNPVLCANGVQMRVLDLPAIFFCALCGLLGAIDWYLAGPALEAQREGYISNWVLPIVIVGLVATFSASILAASKGAAELTHNGYTHISAISTLIGAAMCIAFVVLLVRTVGT